MCKYFHGSQEDCLGDWDYMCKKGYAGANRNAFGFVAASVEDRGFCLPSVCHSPTPVVFLVKINVMLNYFWNSTKRT